MNSTHCVPQQAIRNGLPVIVRVFLTLFHRGLVRIVQDEIRGILSTHRGVYQQGIKFVGCLLKLRVQVVQQVFVVMTRVTQRGHTIGTIFRVGRSKGRPCHFCIRSNIQGTMGQFWFITHVCHHNMGYGLAANEVAYGGSSIGIGTVDLTIFHRPTMQHRGVTRLHQVYCIKAREVVCARGCVSSFHGA